MTFYTSHHVLTDDRRAELRLIATGATRRSDGSLFTPQRTRLLWLERHGYIERTKVPARAGRAAWMASIVVTKKGWEAVREADEDVSDKSIRTMPRWAGEVMRP